MRPREGQKHRLSGRADVISYLRLSTQHIGVRFAELCADHIYRSFGGSYQVACGCV